MHPFPLAGAIGLAIFLAVRFRRLGRATLVLGVLVVVGLALWGFGVVEPPNLTTLIEDVGQRLGKWTYLLVGALAFLETGAFIGLIAPGRDRGARRRRRRRPGRDLDRDPDRARVVLRRRRRPAPPTCSAASSGAASSSATGRG